MAGTDFTWKNKRGQCLYATDWRPETPARAAVALVHGLGEHVGRYAHVAAAFNAAGFSLTGLDLPGHGRSDGKRGHTSYDNVAVEIDHLLEEVRGRAAGAPVFLYGHSLGGALVLYYCMARRPDLKGVIVTSPALGAGNMPASKKLLAQVMGNIYPSLTVPNGLDRANLSRDPQVEKAYSADPLVHGQVSAKLGLDVMTMGGWMVEHAAEFPLPLLLMQGSMDYLVSPQAVEAFAKAAPPAKVTYKVWPGFFHETHNEPEKDQVIGYMVDWMCDKL